MFQVVQTVSIFVQAFMEQIPLHTCHMCEKYPSVVLSHWAFVVIYLCTQTLPILTNIDMKICRLSFADVWFFFSLEVFQIHHL